MAYQHFYSRVPARVSLFNKTDSFDTFAHSSALDESFIRNELSVVYGDKLPYHDLDKIRRGAMPVVYSQTVLPSGRTVQSALSYLQKDYTGERSAYLVHSLVLSEEDRVMAFANNSAVSFNPDMFITDVSLFNLTASNAAPNRCYPDVAYVPSALPNIQRNVKKYNPEIIKGFISAILLALCGNGKSVYFRLPVEDGQASREALELINTVTTVLPAYFKEALSFVTFVTDYTGYPEFKVKCISSDCPDVPPAFGVFFDFGKNLAFGISPEELNSANQLSTFFYSLFENTEVRNSFQDYMLRIMANTNPSEIDMAALAEIVFLFWQSSGFYQEETVVPDDGKVYELLCIYEKHRGALDDNFRCRVYKCIERYPREHLPIPENVYAKLYDIYSTDSKLAKRVVLGAVLSLIHTDIMREKLFAFISDNYHYESVDVRAVINEDLSRVFYGGFLQDELLDFFETNFESEPDDTRRIVFDKLLLSIRTEAIQDRIVEMINSHYDSIPVDSRMKIYTGFYEMIPECDKLSYMLVDLVNRNIFKEHTEVVQSVATKIWELLDMDCSRGGFRLMALLSRGGGFCDDVTTRYAFLRGISDAPRKEYVNMLIARSDINRAEKLLYLHTILPEIGSEQYLQLLMDCKPAFATDVRESLYDLIRVDRSGEDALPPAILSFFRQVIIYPAVSYTMYDAFKVRYGKNGIEVIMQYAEACPEIKNNPKFSTFEAYNDLVDAAQRENVDDAFSALDEMPDDVNVRRDIADHIRMCSLNRHSQSETTALIFELCINFLKEGNFRFDAIFGRMKNEESQRLLSLHDARRSEEHIDIESSTKAFSSIFNVAVSICETHTDYITEVCSYESGLAKSALTFLSSFEIGGVKALRNLAQQAPDELAELITGVIKEYKMQKPGLIGRIFGK